MTRINLIAIDKALSWQAWQKFIEGLSNGDFEKVRRNCIAIEKTLFANYSRYRAKNYCPKCKGAIDIYGNCIGECWKDRNIRTA